MRVVIIGAGIVGCALADELTSRGCTDVTVLDQGPLPVTGGSSSHAPGLVFQTNPSRTMSRLARYTVDKLVELGCFRQIGSLEVATTKARLRELHRRHGFATSWGVPARVVPADECARLHPMLGDGVLGGLHVPSDGLALPVRACQVQAERAQQRGARFLGGQRVIGVDQRDGRVTGVRTTDGAYPADAVVSCAGFWGPAVGALADTPIPLVPMAHQYVRTTPVAPPQAPILRHQDQDLYFRSHGDQVGIGSYRHRPMPVDLADLAPGAHPSMLAFTAADFAESWDRAVELIPALSGASIADGFNGVFSFTADGFPLLGESATVRGFWSAEAVWVTHSAGVGKVMAEWMLDGRPSIDLHECDLNRFHPAQLSPRYVRERAIRSFIEVYDIVHPLDPPSVRGLRVSPFHARHTELGAVFGEAGGWERPLWFAANESLPRRGTARDEWSSRHWSPIAAAEAEHTRSHVALYDMTPLTRLEVTGPVSFLQGLTSNDVDRPVGTVVYTLLLDRCGGVRSDITVARLGEQTFQVGVNGPLDLDRLRRAAPPGVTVRDITDGTCGLGVWGPAARDLVEPLADVDVSHRGFGYFKARRARIGDVPVTMLRLSYVGELGWEIYTDASQGPRLWDTLWAAGGRLGVIAAGRAAFASLRLEKGYRAWGADMTGDHDPYAAGLGFAVNLDSGDFLGRDALIGRTSEQVLTPLVLEDHGCVPMGSEPVYADGRPVGYVTSAAYGHTVGAPIAYAWLPAGLSQPGHRVEVGYFDRMLPARTAAEPLFDPKHERIRR
ncbi:sarcosine dehydrogenase [Mangrovihabitans endophyticus]|uniref:Sarcosine dehydrogenase n=2 Tax=Mangrovihabitans endophyticus TaxID=1751298 RepID=A0A8J3FLM4_9ACTN|nr:sarcosine dehydrogenase [Mangrovihabitans endophyticus]